MPGGASAGLIGPDLSAFVLSNDQADGTVFITDPLAFVLTGGNDGSGLPGTVVFTGFSTQAGNLIFDWNYQSDDMSPGYDSAGYILNGASVQLSDTAPDLGRVILALTTGDLYGFYVGTLDNTGEPGVLSVEFLAAPEPGTLMLMGGLGVLLALIWTGRRLRLQSAALVALIVPAVIPAQTQNHYLPSSITGQLVLGQTVNLTPYRTQSRPQSNTLRAFVADAVTQVSAASKVEITRLPTFQHPPLSAPPSSQARPMARAMAPAATRELTLTMAISQASTTGFLALTHYDQRLANGGNQFSVEPPNPAIAVAGGFVLEGVNNAIRVFDAKSGSPLISTVSSNELFGVAPAIDRSSGVNGVYPTDMRVFYDQDLGRWVVLQRSQDNDIFGTPLDRSHIYMAVSQTADPTAAWNIYTMDTTNGSNFGCPCVPDFPQFGADQYGWYISSNEYNTSTLQFVDAQIFAISKMSMSSGVATPTISRFILPQVTGFEFAIQPASVPPGASQFLAAGGVEYLLSSQSTFSNDNRLAIWAISNTASLQTASPSLLLTQTFVTTQSYSYPDIAVQKPGDLPYGSSLFPPGQLEFIDGGSDSRILSAVYAGGRIFTTFPVQISDGNRSQVGAAYMILSPTFRNAVLSGGVVRQGFLDAPGNNHILRPAIAVNAQGKGAIAFTLVGPDYYPSAAYTTLDVLSTSANIQIAAAGSAPEDGFTGYPGGSFPGIARWGDYSGAVIGSDSAVWMVTEYIPDAPRTTLANWGTFVARYVP
ncbi:MAG: hypothetical protein ABJC09_05735 [Terriglobia bacterium]